jgi:hypothetical protein
VSESVTILGEQGSSDPHITFRLRHLDPVLVLKQDGFHYRGQVIKDAGEAHALFVEFLKSAAHIAQRDLEDQLERDHRARMNDRHRFNEDADREDKL